MPGRGVLGNRATDLRVGSTGGEGHKGRMVRLFRTFYNAYWRFVADDGWAIASHIALSLLMSLFPFLIFLTALAGFLG